MFYYVLFRSQYLVACTNILFRNYILFSIFNFPIQGHRVFSWFYVSRYLLNLLCWVLWPLYHHHCTIMTIIHCSVSRRKCFNCFIYCDFRICWNVLIQKAVNMQAPISSGISFFVTAAHKYLNDLTFLNIFFLFWFTVKSCFSLNFLEVI